MNLKVKLHKESRNRFKTINYRRYPVMIFSKNRFLAQNVICGSNLEIFWCHQNLSRTGKAKLVGSHGHGGGRGVAEE